MIPPAATHTVESRRERIIDRLEHRGRVEVAELATELSVTEETIRRDLRALEDRGLLQRAHGGAIGAEVGLSRSRDDTDGRAAQSHAASRLVADGASVFLDAGPGCEALAAQLAPRAGIRIITTSVAVALAAVAAAERAEVYVLGGTVDSDAVLSGAWAREQLADLHLDMTFVEPSGLTPEGRLLMDDPERASLAVMAMDASESVAMLVGATALGAAGIARFAALEAIDHAVLGEGVELTIIHQLEDAGVAIVTPHRERAR